MAWDKKTGKAPSKPLKCYQTVGQILGAFNQGAAIRMLRPKGLIVNPHPETSDSSGFHFGIIDNTMLAVSKHVPFTQGEIAQLANK
jgi:hypothetical protein